MQKEQALVIASCNHAGRLIVKTKYNVQNPKLMLHNFYTMACPTGLSHIVPVAKAMK